MKRTYSRIIAYFLIVAMLLSSLTSYSGVFASDIQAATATDAPSITAAVSDSVSETVLEKVVAARDGSSYRVTVRFAAAAGIPADAELLVDEITSGTSEYDSYIAAGAQEAGQNISDLDFAHAFDIYLRNTETGERIQPAENVKVNLDFLSNAGLRSGSDTAEEGVTELSLVHFQDSETVGNASPEVVNIDVETGSDETPRSIAFETDSFSVYVVAQYTVDFHYEVNGEMYDFSIPGGGFTTLANVVEVLGIDTSYRTSTGEAMKLGTKEFVGKVESVTLSDDTLVDVSKVEKDTTVGEIKNSRGLECEYSAELSEEEIAEINGSVIEAGDWAIISLKAFSSDEELTVRMANGNEFVVRVTDATRYTITFRVSNEQSGVVYRDSKNNGSNISGVTATNDDEAKQASNTYSSRSVSKPTDSSFTAESGYRFVWWIANQEASLDNETWIPAGTPITPSGIKPYVKQNTTFVAWYTNENDRLIIYNTEAHGSIDKGYSNSSDSEGATATPEDKYTFLGWYDQSGTLVCTTKTFDLSKATTDMIVTAKYQAPVTILYKTKQRDNTGAGTVSISSETVPFGGSAEGATATATSGRFIWWEDSEGNIVSTQSTFVPEHGQIKGTTYYAVFDNATGVVLTVSDPSVAKVSGNNKAPATLYDSMRINPNRDTTYYLWSDQNTRLTNANFVRWEEHRKDGSVTYSTDLSYRILVANISDLSVVEAIVKPANTFIVNYECTTGGTINNTTDYAGSDSAKGARATANAGDGYRFLGWYTTNASGSEIRLTTAESFDAAELASWVSADGGVDGKSIFKDEQVITARFGIGHTITYQRQYGETTEDLGTEITAGADDRKGYTAENDVPGYNFSAWYLVADGTETKISDNAALTNAVLRDLTINSDVTIRAKYEKAASATYKVNYIDAGKEGVSNFGKVVVNLQTVEYDGSFTDTVGSNGKLRYTAVARPARGCEFVNWTVTDKNGNPTTVAGLNVNDPTIENLALSDDVILTANFQKKSGAIEIIYNIQYDTQAYYWATIKVGDKSASGTQTENVYLSEVVPAGEAALGCSATPTHTGRIIGWTYGADNTAEDSRIHGNDKDNVFLMSSQFVPAGDYLKDEEGTGYRYYSVIVKPDLNVYIQTKVNIAEAGDWWHGERGKNNDYYTDKILFVFNRSRTYEQQGVVDAQTNFSTNFTPYKVDINPGYKLIGFTYNGKDVEVDYTTGGDNNDYVATDTRKLRNLNASEILLKNSVEIDNAYYIPGTTDTESIHYLPKITVNNLYDFIFYSTLFRTADGDAGVDKDVNVLIANYVKSGNYNFQYRIKSGEGTISKYSDNFSVAELAAGEKEDGSELIIGSLAMDNLDKDSVFVQWEYTDENNVLRTYDKAQLDANAIKELTGKDLNELENDPKIYTFYAVFEAKKKVIVRYESEDPNNKGTVTIKEEVVYESKTPTGSTAEPFPGMTFTNWTLKSDSSLAGENTTLVPEISTDKFNYDPDNDPVPVITYVAHFKTATDTKIIVQKIVTAPDDIKDHIDQEVYFGVYKDNQLLKNKDGTDMIKGLNIIDGVPQGEVVFEGLDYIDPASGDKYEIWELHKVGSSYVTTYTGMLIGEDYVLSAIKGTNNSQYSGGTFNSDFGSGNNAILTKEHNEATVRIENVYASVTDPLTFVAQKVWSNRNKNAAPVGAKVELTVYSSISNDENDPNSTDRTTKAVKSIVLDGTPDENGETTAWVATFTNLPQLDGDGFYEVKETSALPVGYTAYVGDQVMTPTGNVYLTTSGGKIYNVRNVDPTGTLVINKSFSVPTGYSVSDFATALSNKVTFTLTDGGAFTKEITLTIGADGKATGATMDGYTPTVEDGIVTIPGLPPGEYTLTETKTNTITVNGSVFNWTLEYADNSDVETDEKCEIIIGETTKLILTNKYTLPSLTITKTVTGGMGDPSKEFTFTLNVAGSSKAYSYTITRKNETTSTGNVSGNGGTFTLADGDTIVINDLPIDTDITVTEAKENYTTTWKLGDAIQSADTNNAVTFTLTDDATLSVTNNLEPVSPTGIHFNLKPFLFMLFAGLGLLLLRRRKRGDVD